MRAFTEAAKSLLRDLLASAPKGASSTTEQVPPDESRLPEAERALQGLDPDMPYPEWVRVGMALKTGVGDAALPAWVEWSSLGAKYRPGEPEEKWASFRRDEVGLGTLFEMAKVAGFRPGPSAVEQFEPVRARTERMFKPLDEFEERRMDWLWRPFLPRGHLSIVAGNAGEGKTTVLLDLAARLSRGAPLPGQAAAAPPGPSLIVNAEDGVEDTLKGRLRAMGADQAKVFAFDRHAKDALLPQLPDRVDEVERWLLENPGAHLVVLDPLDSFIPLRLDPHKSRDVRQSLDALVALAERFRVAIAVVAHIGKNTSVASALHRVLGSVGITAAARSVVGVGEQEDTGLRAVVQVKRNLVGREEPSFSFETQRLDPMDPDSPVIVKWGEESWLTADDLWQPPARGHGRRPERRSEAEVWLDARLKPGAEAPAGLLQDEAEIDGINTRTLQRAAGRLGIEPRKAGPAAPWIWRRPS
ncbi:MAG TPA: AAA family ATPase [Methylomirabilota bacterium]|nr:AAA family ATPase [Methylomirabilota bacterium]